MFFDANKVNRSVVVAYIFFGAMLMAIEYDAYFAILIATAGSVAARLSMWRGVVGVYMAIISIFWLFVLVSQINGNAATHGAAELMFVAIMFAAITVCIEMIINKDGEFTRRCRGVAWEASVFLCFVIVAYLYPVYVGDYRRAPSSVVFFVGGILISVVACVLFVSILTKLSNLGRGGDGGR